MFDRNVYATRYQDLQYFVVKNVLCLDKTNVYMSYITILTIVIPCFFSYLLGHSGAIFLLVYTRCHLCSNVI